MAQQATKNTGTKPAQHTQAPADKRPESAGPQNGNPNRPEGGKQRGRVAKPQFPVPPEKFASVPSEWNSTFAKLKKDDFQSKEIFREYCATFNLGKKIHPSLLNEAGERKIQIEVWPEGLAFDSDKFAPLEPTDFTAPHLYYAGLIGAMESRIKQLQEKGNRLKAAHSKGPEALKKEMERETTLTKTARAKDKIRADLLALYDGDLAATKAFAETCGLGGLFA